MSLNFDAKLNLDISAFLGSIKEAEAAVDSLQGKITALNSGSKLNTNIQVPGISGIGARQQAANRAMEMPEYDNSKNIQNLARERYALYDVAAAYAMMSAAGVKALTAVSSAAIDYERAFADVTRTTEFTSAKVGEAASVMQYDLQRLASEIPVAFQDITKIATVGNQLGIAQGAITSFTDTVAKFAATTGISVDATAMAFGRIGELLQVPSSEFNKLGSSIAYAGVNAVATEEQILSVTKEIATTAKMAKFSTSEIVGLSTALSSLGIAPEAARGSIIRTFAAINQAISKGGDELQAYARIAGMSAQQFSSEWQKNGQVAFDAFLQGLQNMSDSGQNLDTVLRSIGIKNVRDIQTVQKLGDNYDVYAKSIQDANKGFEEGTFLGQAYGVIQETVASKLQLVSNSWQTLLAGIGEGVVDDPFKGFLDRLNELLVSLNDFVRSPVGRAVTTIALAFAALATAVATVNGVMALGRATMLAFKVSLVGIEGAANGAAVGLTKAKIAAMAFSNFLKAAGWLAAIGVISSAIMQIADAFTPVEDKAESLLGGFSGLQDAITADTLAFGQALSDLGGNVEKAKEATGTLQNMTTTTQQLDEQTQSAVTAQQQFQAMLGNTTYAASEASSGTKELSFSIGENTRAWFLNAIAQSDAFQKMSQNAQLMQELTNADFSFSDAFDAAATGSLDEYIAKTETAILKNVELGQSSAGAYDLMILKSRELGGVFGEINEFFIKLQLLIPGWVASLLGIDLTPIANTLDAAANAARGATAEVSLLASAAAQAAAQTERINAISANQQVVNNYYKTIRNGAKAAAKEVRTVIDYANDLNNIFNRIVNIRFGQQIALDDIASGWNNIAQRAADAQDAVARANAEIQELTADKSILEYQLSVAERYGDEKRAAVLRAKLAKLDQQIADKAKEAADAQEQASNATEGNSDAAINNRAALLNLVGGYQDYIKALVESGLKGKKLQEAIQKAKDDFYAQGQAVGFSKDQLDPYAKLFDDFSEAVAKTPRKVTVDFDSNLSPADQALKEYLAKLDKVNQTYTTTIRVKLPDTTLLKKIVDGETYRFMLRAFENKTITAKQFYKGVYGVDLNNYAEGGYVTGPGTATSDSILARLSNGEFVIRAAAVKNYGVDFLNAINEQRAPMGLPNANAGGGTAAAGGANIVYLSPDDRALLRAALDRPIALYTENTKIAQSANAGNVVLAQRGSK